MGGADARATFDPGDKVFKGDGDLLGALAEVEASRLGFGAAGTQVPVSDWPLRPSTCVVPPSAYPPPHRYQSAIRSCSSSR